MLLDALSNEQLLWSPSPRARSIAGQFAHLHQVRGMWLDSWGIVTGKVEKGAEKTELRGALELSSESIAGVLGEAEKTGKLRNSKRGPVAFLGYLLAHEGHHRGQILLHLKSAGLPVDPKIAQAIWEWQKI